MNAALKELRARIKLCEDFMSLCQRIKELERESHHLPVKKSRLESDRAELAEQVEPTVEELNRLESLLSGSERSLSAFEEGLLKDALKTCRIRLGLLKENLGQLSDRIQEIERMLSRDDDELLKLYAQLEQLITVHSLDPDSVSDEHALLCKQTNELRARLRHEVSAVRADEGSIKPRIPDGTAFNEQDFFQALAEDLKEAKKSVEVISPQLLPLSRTDIVLQELARLAEAGINAAIYTLPFDHQQAPAVRELIRNAHNRRITVIQKSELQYNAVIIDSLICWEGTVRVLAASPPGATMRRTVASSHVRELRHFLFKQSE